MILDARYGLKAFVDINSSAIHGAYNSTCESAEDQLDKELDWLTVWNDNTISFWDERPDPDAYVGLGLFVAVSLLDQALAAKERAEAERDAAVRDAYRRGLEERDDLLRGQLEETRAAKAEVTRLTSALAGAQEALDQSHDLDAIVDAITIIDAALSHLTTEPAKAEERDG
jgi:hypothetical protein